MVAPLVSSETRLSCFCREPKSPKRRSQMRHLYGLTPVCRIMCRRSSMLRTHEYPHTLRKRTLFTGRQGAYCIGGTDWAIHGCIAHATKTGLVYWTARCILHRGNGAIQLYSCIEVNTLNGKGVPLFVSLPNLPEWSRIKLRSYIGDKP